MFLCVIRIFIYSNNFSGVSRGGPKLHLFVDEDMNRTGVAENRDESHLGPNRGDHQHWMVGMVGKIGSWD